MNVSLCFTHRYTRYNIKTETKGIIIMNKKIVLFLLPLTLSMVSCGKDLDPKVDKVDLVRLLNSSEIFDAFKLIEENYSKNLVSLDANYSLINDDLINQRTETEITGSIKIKGDGYSETKAEMSSKIKNNFYTYTSKMVQETKTAIFGDYYITLSESYKDGQKDQNNATIDYASSDGTTIAEASASLPITLSDLNNYTVGVDSFNNLYAVYSSETISTQEGRDNEGKDATFINKTTKEVLAKFGNLKNPRLESFKTVNKQEVNYNEELKVYKDYQTILSTVSSYKFQYGNLGRNDGKDKFINSLPERSLTAVSINCLRYYKTGGDSYTDYDVNHIYVASIRNNCNQNIYKFEETGMEFLKDYAYNFEASYQELLIDKANQGIITSGKTVSTYNFNSSDDIESLSKNISGKDVKLLRLKAGKYSSNHTVVFDFDPNSGSLTVTPR